MPKNYLRQPEFKSNSSGRFTRSKEKILKFRMTGESIYIFMKTNYIQFGFSMTWLMETLRTGPEKQLLITCCMMKNLILTKIQIMLDINKGLLQ